MINHGFRRLALAHSLLSPAIAQAPDVAADATDGAPEEERRDPADKPAAQRPDAPYTASAT
jgi:hypothetical protein